MHRKLIGKLNLDVQFEKMKLDVTSIVNKIPREQLDLISNQTCLSKIDKNYFLNHPNSYVVLESLKILLSKAAPSTWGNFNDILSENDINEQVIASFCHSEDFHVFPKCGGYYLISGSSQDSFLKGKNSLLKKIDTSEDSFPSLVTTTPQITMETWVRGKPDDRKPSSEVKEGPNPIISLEPDPALNRRGGWADSILKDD